MIGDEDNVSELAPYCGSIDFDGLREIADRVRSEGQSSGYGYFPGGDPRDFTCDPESCSDEEMQSHREACAAWEDGLCVDVGGACHWYAGYATDVASRIVIKITKPTYGVGVYITRDESMTKLAQELDDWIDKARQVMP